MPKPDPRHDIQITVGTVKATDSRATGGTIERGATHARIHVSPVVWLEDQNGTEHAFEGSSFANVRAGHKILVVTKRSSGKIIRVYNKTTDTTNDSNDLIPLKPGPNNMISGTLMLAVIGMFPVIVIYTAIATFLRENILGRDPQAFEVGSHFPYIAIIVLALSAWLTTTLIAKSKTTAKVLSDVVDDTVRSAGLLGSADD